MEIINNPHDRFFKQIFSNIEVARDFILNYLPEDLLKITDLRDMEIIKDSFVEKELKETFSDMLYKVKFNDRRGYLYLLFEHKSYPNKLTAFQLLRYMTNIWDLTLKQDKESGDKLPLIIPLVFYHGERKWNIGLRFSDLMNEIPAVEEYVPDFRYLLYDFSEYTDREIIGSVQVRLILSVMHNIYREPFEDELEDILVLLNKLEDTNTVLEYFEVVMRYIINVKETTLSELKKKVEKTMPERRPDLMTLAEKLREEGKLEGKKEGLKEGMKEGLKEGRKEELANTIQILLLKKLNIDKLATEIEEAIKSAHLDELEEIRDNIFEIESLDELGRYLNL